jgi:methyl-accepting chemotaxis protein
MTEYERDRMATLTAAMWAAIVTAVLMAVVTGVATWQWQQSREASRRSDQVVMAANAVLADLADMETGQRGYLLVGEGGFREPYNKGTARLGRDTLAFRAVMRQGLEPEIAVRVSALATEKVAELNRTLALATAHRVDSARTIVRIGLGKAIMDSMRAAVGALNGFERDSVDAHRRAEATWASIARFVLVVGTLLMIGVLLFLRRALWRYAREQSHFIREMEQQLQELESQARKLGDGGLAKS